MAGLVSAQLPHTLLYLWKMTSSSELLSTGENQHCPHWWTGSSGITATLGVTLEDRCYGLKADIMFKRAQYIVRNCKLLQEFDFCHPDARSHLNMVFRTTQVHL